MVAAVVFLLVGIVVCIFGVYLYIMFKMIRDLKKSVDTLTMATHELIGEGSFARISKSLTALSSQMPDMLGGLKEFSRVMSLFFANAFDREKVAAVTPAGNDGEFYPHDEIRAAEREVAAEAKRHNISLTPADMAAMRTDE